MPAWHAHPDVWFLIAALVFGYALVLRVSPRVLASGGPAGEVPEAPVSSARRWAFWAGVVALWLGADWPVHELSENFLFSVHMVQHTLFSLVAPPLLLLGLPPWFLRRMIRPAPVFHLVRFLTRPLVALILFNAVILITHWPVIVNAALRSEPLHFTVHFVLFSSALLMWWPVIDPLPEMKKLSEPGKMLYLFLQSILPTVPASFLTFANEPIYRFYETVPRLWGIDVVNDQQIAGLIMKIGGGLLLWMCIAAIYFRWNAKEERGESEEITWEVFERELEVWDLKR
ncbi:MAG TPA: cytochrome c oxidase assembly protein [Actinomycetota bacterium]|nr:cytochrome c oxidase assembly protein [Actinomycetota bacterium]